MYRISKTFTFSASHQLHGLRPGHPCGRLHGHNYKVRAILAGRVLDGNGFLLDYGDLAPFRDWIDTELDHRHLNDVAPFDQMNPTAEHLAGHLASVLAKTVPVPQGVRIVVAVSETPKTWAQVVWP